MKSRIDVMVCDRCDLRDEIPAEHPHGIYSWGRITAAECNGPKWIGSQDGKTFMDLCPACMTHLMSWWTAGRAALDKDAGHD